MADQENDNQPEDQGKVGPGNPPKEYRWKPGQSGNPKGRTPAGATIREHINSMCDAGLTEDEIRKIARDRSQPWPRRAAAERILRTFEAGDLSDFAGLIRGENNLEDLRAMGVNTEVIKKIKQKTRRVPVADGTSEEIVEREIELHDRAGADFDRICDRTDGRPNQSLTLDANVTAEAEVTISPADVQAVLAVLNATKPAPETP